MNSPIAWYGGKHYLAPKLLKLLPQHTTYVEVFGGGGSLLFAKPPSPIEVYNDIDSGLVNFWKVVRDPDKYQRLIMLLELTPYARAEYYDCVKTWQEAGDDIERARRWFAAIRQGYSGHFDKGWGYTSVPGSSMTSKYLSAIRLLPEIHRRLLNVLVDCKDWQEIISTWDAPDTLFYLDPPYVLSTRVGGKGYTHETTDDDHRRLVEVLLVITGKVILSGYAHEIYTPLELAGWQRLQWQQQVFSNAGEYRTECVWLSPSAQTTQLPFTYDEVEL